jgi:hypothetical protein
MFHWKVTLPAVILLGGFLVCSTASYGKPEYTKSTKKACAYCHVDSKAKPKELTEAGKHYSEHKNFDSYKGTK